MNAIPLQSLLDQGVVEGVFPSAQAVVVHQGRTLFQGASGEATLNTLFDLASVTKIFCTTALFLTAWEREELILTSRRKDLLYHRSGLPAFTPFFVSALNQFPTLIQQACPAITRHQARAWVVEAARKVTPQERPGISTLYSDIGFILLGDELEQSCGKRLDELFLERIGGPLALGAHFRPLSASRAHDVTQAIAPTGTLRPRPPAPGQEGMWTEWPGVASPLGEVDDDNAWAMDGVAGHAGLFGTANDLAKFGQAILDDLDGAGRMASQDHWHQAIQVDSTVFGSTRAMGFDTPDRSTPSSAGNFLGNGPLGAIGHLGFTGTSLWIDLSRKLVVALCSNRTYLGRDNLLIRAFRPRFHDAAIHALE